MSNFAQTRTTYNQSDRRWARNFLALDTHDITLDGTKWPAGTVVKSGTHIGRLTASKLGAPYNDAATDGTQRLRYFVGDRSNGWLKARKDLDEDAYIAHMRGSFL